MTRPSRLSRRKRLVFSAAVLATSFGVLELVLTLGGVEYARTPRAMKQAFVEDYIGWQNASVELQHFQPHPVRMWSPLPGVGLVNAEGFQGASLPRDRTPGVLRVLFLGDSCTNAGPQGYPEQTIRSLERRALESESLIAGCGGYSTWQGLAWLKEALEWRPDVVVAYFGWNDHWVSPLPDHEFVAPGVASRWLSSTLGRARTYQLLHRLIHPPVPGGRLPRDPERIIERVRVPPPQFSDNVRRITKLTEAAGAKMVWVSPPSAKHVVETDKSVLIGHTELIPAVHSRYVDLLREAVGQLPAARLVELAAFDRQTMLPDGIHPTAAGNGVIAAALADVIAATLEQERR